MFLCRVSGKKSNIIDNCSVAKQYFVENILFRHNIATVRVYITHISFGGNKIMCCLVGGGSAINEVFLL